MALELESLELFPNYISYICPVCFSQNMFDRKNNHCCCCQFSVADCDLLQNMTAQRICYYNRKDIDVRNCSTDK